MSTSKLDQFLIDLEQGEQMERQLVSGPTTGDTPRLADLGKPIKRHYRIALPAKPNANCRLTDDDVVLVRQLYATGLPIADIADKFDVSTALIDAILRRKRRGKVK